MAPWVEGQLIIEWESERQHGSQGAHAAPGAGVRGGRKAALSLADLPSYGCPCTTLTWAPGGPAVPDCLAHCSLRTLVLTAASVCSPLP